MVVEKKKGEIVLSKLAPLFTKLEGTLKNRCTPSVRSKLPAFVVTSAEGAHNQLAIMQFQYRSLVEGRGVPAGAWKIDQAMEYINGKACRASTDLDTMVAIAETAGCEH